MIPHDYQWDVTNWLIQKLYIDDEPGAAVFADPGLGKTLISLLTSQRLRTLRACRKILLISPLNPLYFTWPAEVHDWGFKFKLSMVHGSGERQRIRGLANNADIYLLNPDGVRWLANFDQRFWPRFDLLIVDESTAFKNWSADRTQFLCKGIVPHVPKRIILTGTPTPRTMADLFAQIYILDEGERLGTTEYQFQERFCKQEGRSEWNKYGVRKEKRKELENTIQDIVYRLDRRDHLDLPDVVSNPIWLDLPNRLRDTYDQLEEEFFVELEKESEDKQLVASSAAAKYQMLKQFCNGGLYESETLPSGRRLVKATHHLHRVKLDALSDLMGELHGKPLLVAYQFKHDKARITKRYSKTPSIDGELAGRAGMIARRELVSKWNKGEIPLMLCHPEALSHGANMQKGGSNLAWFGLTDNAEHYVQLNARLDRQGQENTVGFHHLMIRDSIEEVMWERLNKKIDNQTDLLDSLKEYRNARTAKQGRASKPATRKRL